MSATIYPADAWYNGTCHLMGQVRDYNGDLITQSQISTIEYTIYTMDSTGQSRDTAVTGHDGVSLPVADHIHDTPKTASTVPAWDGDSEGFNFDFTPDASSNMPFPTQGDPYIVEVTLTPYSGQIIRNRWRVQAV